MLLELRSQPAAHAQQKGVALSVEMPADPVSVRADRENIAWVVGHLLENAIKFTEPGGSVTLRCVPGERLVTIEVADTGVGIPPDKLAEVFEEFHQLDNSSTRRYGGTGLGLSLVKRILETHQTEIRVESTLGQGSCFFFTLPITTEKIIAGT